MKNTLKDKIVTSPRRLLRVLKSEMEKGKGQPGKMAGSIGLGLFFGIVPIWGFQTLAAFTSASLLKLNRVVVLLATNISFPIFIPFIIFFSFQFGALFVEDPIQLPSFIDLNEETIYLQINQYLIGAVLLAFTIGALGFLGSFIVLKAVWKTKRERA